jgi:hypothetical protein
MAYREIKGKEVYECSDVKQTMLFMNVEESKVIPRASIKPVIAANVARMEMVFGFLGIYSPFSSLITYFPKKPIHW